MSPPLAPSYLGPASLAALFILLLVLEALRPLRRRKLAQGRRLALNLSLSATVFATGAYAVKPLALLAAAWVGQRSVGLLQVLPLPFWAQFTLGFCLMDLTFYYWHRLNHTRRLLWRFHNIHHVDPDLDVSTSFRFHPVEILYSAAFRLLQVGLVGLTPFIYGAYELVFQGATLFHHSNLKLPVRLERLLNKVVVTPRMHGIHHSVIGRETNSNYSVIFSWWDRMHRSLRLNVGQAEVIIGVPGYLRPEDNRFLPLLKFPFVKQRPYWRWPSGKAAVRPAAPAVLNMGFMVE